MSEYDKSNSQEVTGEKLGCEAVPWLDLNTIKDQTIIGEKYVVVVEHADPNGMPGAAKKVLEHATILQKLPNFVVIRTQSDILTTRRYYDLWFMNKKAYNVEEVTE